MAGWKKIIVSGSSAELLYITASGAISASSISTKTLIVTGSGEISASSLLLGTDLEVQHGGTGQSTLTQGHILLGNGTTGIASVASGSLNINDLSFSSEYAKGLVSASDALAARTHIGLASMASQSAGSVDIDGGDIDGVTLGFNSEIIATGSFSGSFVGDGSGLTGVSVVGSLVDLSDVGSTPTASGDILIGDGTSVEAQTISGDITLSSTGVVGLQTGSVYSHSLAPGIDLQVSNITGSNISASGTLTSDTLVVKGNSTFTNPVTASGGAHVEGTLWTDGTKTIGLHVDNDISASGFIGEYFEITSSILITSESTTFGNDVTDIHTFHGDIATVLTGSVTFSQAAGLAPTDYFQGPDGAYSYLSGSGISGSTSMNVDFRSALGGVTGSFFGSLRGPTSESLSDRIGTLESSTTTDTAIGVATASLSASLSSSIQDNTTNIAANDTDITALFTSASEFTASIATNVTNIATNDTDITALFTSASEFTASIATNVTDITALFTSASEFTASIATNVTNIATNETNITTNTTDITALETTASALVSDYSKVQNVDTDGTPTFGGLTVKGNFTVDGTTTANETIINTTTIAVEDNIILLNSGSLVEESTALIDAGIQVERTQVRGYNSHDVGRAKNANLFWDESAARWATILSETSASKIGDTSTEIQTNAQFSGDIQYLATVSHSDGAPTASYYGSTDSNETAYRTRYGQIHIDSGSGDIWIYGA